MLVEAITNATAGQFDFTSIPSGYSRLIIQGHIRSNEVSIYDSDEAFVFYNGLFTETDYHCQLLWAQDGSTFSAEAATPMAAYCPADSAVSGSYAAVKITIEGYDDSSIIKHAYGQYGYINGSTTDLVAGIASMSHKTTTAAITRLTVRADQHATYGLLGTLRLYAEN